MAHILMVLDKHYPPDLRVENEASTLQEAGFEVTVLAVSPDVRPTRETHDGVRVIRERLPAFARNKMRGLAGTLPLLDAYLGRRIRKVHEETKIDVLHAHDLYLFGACIRAGRKLSIPVVGDMHENWVEALRHYRWSTRFPGRLVINFRRWERLEREWSEGVDGLVVVIDEMRERLERTGVQNARTAVVPNTIRLSSFDSWPIEHGILDPIAGSFTIVYTGGMDKHRGLSSAIEAMPLVLRDIPRARLILVGDGAMRADLERQAQSLGQAVLFTGWQAQEKIPTYIAAADVGLIPHRKTAHTDNTIPHKLFHYMHSSLPVVASDCQPLRRILESEKAGLIYPSEDPVGLAEALVLLGQDPEMRAELGRNGYNAVQERFNWRATSRPLIDLYRDIIS
jgi:glycosyltransferase involved in cell wall biosynthesis